MECGRKIRAHDLLSISFQNQFPSKNIKPKDFVLAQKQEGGNVTSP